MKRNPLNIVKKYIIFVEPNYELKEDLYE